MTSRRAWQGRGQGRRSPLRTFQRAPETTSPQVFWKLVDSLVRGSRPPGHPGLALGRAAPAPFSLNALVSLCVLVTSKQTCRTPWLLVLPLHTLNLGRREPGPSLPGPSCHGAPVKLWTPLSDVL